MTCAPVISSNKYLVWGLAFGTRGVQLAKTWLAALKEVGGWEHDIVILGDSGILKLTNDNVRVIDIVEDVCLRYRLKKEEWTHWTLNNLKSQIAYYVDISPYSYLLYLDIDVIVNSNRLISVINEK